MKYMPSHKPAWAYPSDKARTLNAKQLKWIRLCQSAEALAWMPNYVNPHQDDKPPPMPWTDQQLIHLAATLIHTGKAETLRAILLLLLHDDLVELIDSRRK